MGTLSTDTCIRPNQSGLGISSGGETYAINGTITTSISSDEAVVAGSGGFTSVLLGTQTTADIDFTVRVQQTNNNFDGVGPCWRASANGQNCYFVAIYSGNLLFAKLVSNGFTQLASANISEVSGTYYQMHVKMIGNHLQARAWQDGTSEPGTWNIDTTDSTYSAAGRYGMSFNAFSGAGVKFDHITVTDAVTAVALSSTMSGAGSLSATLSATTALAATIPGVGACAGNLAADAALAASIASAGALTGTLAVVTALSVTFAASSSLSGAFSYAAMLSVLFAGVGLIARAHLSLPASASVPGIAVVSDAAYGVASIGDVLVDQASASDVATGSVTISDQG